LVAAGRRRLQLFDPERTFDLFSAAYRFAVRAPMSSRESALLRESREQT
jgi:hypothetical protein